MTPLERLEYLRSQIEAECISWGEIDELQDLIEYIDPADVLLLQWAGVPEFPEEEAENPWDLTREAPGSYEDWQYEVGNGDTLLGFADWFQHKKEEEA